MTAEAMAYVGREACGCLQFLAVDSPENRAEVIREVAACIRDGGYVERMTVVAARAVPHHMCPRDEVAE